MNKIFLLLLLLVIPLTTAIDLYPPQIQNTVYAWTENDFYAIEISHSVDESVLYITMDTDENGIVDRGGKPIDQQVYLAPAGLIRGSVEGSAVLTFSCQHPSFREYEVNNNFVIPLPAGECIITELSNGLTTTYEVTVTANDIVDVTLNTRNSSLIPIIAGSAIFSGILFLLFTQKRKKELNPTIRKLLNEKEKQIIEYLQERGPQLAGVVRKDLAISKTTFHRTKQKLLDKQLIIQEEYGNTTKLRWNESFHSK